MRKSAILLIAHSAFALAGCGSGVTLEGDSPITIPEQVEAGGVTIQTPDEINVGGATVETEGDRITVK